MKNLILIIAAIILANAQALSSTCLPEGITCYSQAQIDNFQSNYPGCTEIEGDVLIFGSEITSLNGLSVLTTIGGSLEISACHSLHSLSGLEDITSIGGDFEMNANSNLDDLSGLNGLTTVGGYLQISTHTDLETLHGLNNLQSIGGELIITSNYHLEDISALSNIDPNSISDLSIHHNQYLSNCNIECVCGYLADPHGPINIYLNEEGCNTPSEVAMQCGLTLQCLPYGNYYFTEPSHVYSFKSNFPGCTNLKGNVEIRGWIHWLDSLNEVTSIEGNLTFSNASMNNFEGMSNLETIGGDLKIYQCDLLSKPKGLEKVSTIGGSCIIWLNDVLNSLEGLENLDSIKGDFSLVSNANLGSLFRLQSLSYIGGFLRIYNHKIINLNGLENLKYIGDYLLINDNPNLYNLKGLEGLTGSDPIEGHLRILYNDALTEMSALSNVTSIGGSIDIWGNSSITSLTGLENLVSIGESLDISGNSSLTDLSALEGLTSIPENLEISGLCTSSISGMKNITFIGNQLGIFQNNFLTHLEGFESLESIGELSIGYNDGIISMEGLENLNSISGEIWIRENPALTSLSGLENIDPNSISNLTIDNNSSLSGCSIAGICNYLAQPGGVVNIYNNDLGCNTPIEVATACNIQIPCLPFGNYYFHSQAEIDNFNSIFPGCTELEGDVRIAGNDITNLLGLIDLTSIGGSLKILSNPSLESLTGLEGLIEIGGDLEIKSNLVLTNLSGLEGLSSIGGTLNISYNDILTSLSGLDNIDAWSISDLTIYCNTDLSACAIQSVCDYLASPNGDIEIECNASGCSNLEEVMEVCIFLDIENKVSDNGFAIFPNPFSKSTSFKYQLDEKTFVTLLVYNQLGRIVKTLANEQQNPGNHMIRWHADDIPPGLYYYHITMGQEYQTGKMIIVK